MINDYPHDRFLGNDVLLDQINFLVGNSIQVKYQDNHGSINTWRPLLDGIH